MPLIGSSNFVEVKDKYIKEDPIITTWKKEIENQTKLYLKENSLDALSDVFYLFAKFTEKDEQMKDPLMKNNNLVFNISPNKNKGKTRLTDILISIEVIVSIS
jgi:hypothetical protein